MVHPGIWTAKKTDKKKMLDNCAGSLIELASYSALKNIKIAIENLPPEFLCDSTEEIDYVLKKTIKSFKNNNKGHLSDYMGICLDTGHANLKNNLNELLNEFKNKIFSIHLHDNIGDTGKDRSLGLDDLHLVPGKGNTGWSAFFKNILNINYKGFIILEIISDNNLPGSAEYLLKDIKKFIKSLSAV